MQHNARYVLGDPKADSRGERQIKRAKSVRAGGSESLQDGRKSPWEHTFNGLVQEPFAFLLLIEHKFWGIVCFVLNQRSAYFTVPFVTSYTECNFAKSSTQMSLVRAEIIITDFPSHSFTRPTIEESSSKLQWDSQSWEIEKFGKGTQGKREQQVRKSD